MTHNSTKLVKLEAVRGLAALYVVIHHSLPKNLPGAALFRFGQEAVILFFVLSGIVIHYSFQRGLDKSFHTYFVKRALRIYVPLLAVFSLTTLLVQPRPFPWAALAGNLLMLQDIPRLKPGVAVGTYLGNLPLWSLSYEWWFYMLYYLLYRAFGDKANRAAYGLGLLGGVLYVTSPTFITRLLLYLPIWWTGTEIGALYLRGESINLRTLARPLSVLLACTALAGLNVLLNHETLALTLGEAGPGYSPWLELRHLGAALWALAAGMAWQRLGWLGFNRLVMPLARLAPISYGLYISHYLLLSKAHYLDGYIASPALRFGVYLALCLGFSYAVERGLYPWCRQVMERPLRWSRLTV